jgi:hypothetical protein
MDLENEPLAKGMGDWAGVVMIQRPDLSKMSLGDRPLCRVMSARTVQFDGRRAIDEWLPYEMFAGYFSSTDGDHIFCESEYKSDGQGGGFLQVYGLAQTNLKEWVIYSMGADKISSAGQMYQ